MRSVFSSLTAANASRETVSARPSLLKTDLRDVKVALPL